jgi:hypothetical protein
VTAPRQLQLFPLKQVGEQPALFGPATPIVENAAYWRSQGDLLRDHRSVHLGLPLMRAAELLGLEPRQLAEVEQGLHGFVLLDAKAMFREALK